jgi:hypothetical protein
MMMPVTRELNGILLSNYSTDMELKNMVIATITKLQPFLTTPDASFSELGE